MKSKTSQENTDFKVTCTWCGGLIRHSNVKDSRGMCLICYARMLNDHFRARQTGVRPGASSER
jgi:hypothetical protein